MPDPTVLTVILNFRTPAMTVDCIAVAVRAMEGVAGAITVVDNASGDGSETILARAIQANGWDRVRLIVSPVNGGFGAGNNVGIRAGLPDGSRPDLIYLLNSDAFPEPDAIRLLRDYMVAHPDVGFAGSSLYGPTDGPHRSAFRFPSLAGEIEAAARLGPISRMLERYIVAMPIPARSGPVDWLAGASLMMRQEVLDRIGLFDEGFFLYFEETDLCRRAARAGYPTHYVVESRVAHISSGSTGLKTSKRMPDYWFDSRMRYFTKTHGRAYGLAATGAHVLGGLLWRARLLVQRKDRGDPPYFLRDLIAHAVRWRWRGETGA